ncbi:T9SS type A sorting domain-containing protein [Hymenobacter bucti]
MLVSVSLLLATPGAWAQVQYANKVVMADGIVSDDNKAADSNLATNATIKPSLLLGYTRLRMSFPSTAAAGKEAGMYIKPNILISAALLGGATLTTYYKKGTKTTEVDSHQLSSDVLSLNVQAAGINRISFTPTKEFNQIELVFFSVLALGQDIEVYEAFSTVSPLPVSLVAFQGAATPEGVALSWATASEHNAEQFVVERAADAPVGFAAIGQVPCTGTTTQTQAYGFVDPSPAPRSYYRLRQLDRDGTVTFSPVVAVQWAAPAALRAYPSPTTGTLHVAGAGAGTQFSIFDQLGHLVQRPQAPEDLGPLDVQALPSGLYFLQDDATGQRTKFLKTN